MYHLTVLQDTLRRDDLKPPAQPKGRKPRKLKLYAVLQANNLQDSLRILRGRYSRRQALKAVRLLKRWGLEAWISPVIIIR